MSWLRALTATLALAGCRFFEPGLPVVYDGGVDDVRPPDLMSPRPPDAAPAPDLARDAWRDEPAPPGPPGPPEDLGCADGTREGFRSVAHWGNIAGCAGAWTVPGVLTELARAPQCQRGAGNDGANPSGEGCSASDLCALGWHVCEDAGDVGRKSGSGCESAVPAGSQQFFLVLAGASLQGICSPDRAAMNDLHGCGDLGQPQSAACQPLNRRMTFADCQASGVWACGAVDEHLYEAALVTKRDAAFGGVLCCRND